jgi:GNAT superfamily N-acetyltransferase
MEKAEMARLRAARAEELRELNALCLRSKAMWGYDQAFLDACKDELKLDDAELETSFVAVAEAGGTIAGVAQVELKNSEANLLKMFVEPANVNCGIGRMLFRWACDEARKNGACRLVIESDPYAVQFYRRMGARDVGLAPSGSIAGRMLSKLSFDLSSGRCVL